jgi:hypothetical protein
MSRYDEEVRVRISPGSEGILPSQTRRGRDALAPCVAPGVNSYEDQRTKALQAGGALPGDAFFRHALASHLWFKASGCPTFTGWFLGSPCIPSLVLGFRTPKLPLLPVWEKGVGGMRGQTRPEYNQTINPRCLATACALSFEPGAEFDPPAAMLPLPTLAYTPVRGCCLAAHWDSE